MTLGGKKGKQAAGVQKNSESWRFYRQIKALKTIKSV